MKEEERSIRVQERCESRHGRPGLPVTVSLQHGLCGRMATLEEEDERSCVTEELELGSRP